MTPEQRAADCLRWAGRDNVEQMAPVNLRALIADAIRAAVDEEREACARVAEDLSPADPADARYRGGREACGRVAAAIRARGYTIGSGELGRKLLRIAGELLDVAADRFGSHVCNDWDWPAWMTPQDRLAVARAMVADNVRKPPEELSEQHLEDVAAIADRGPPDWWMMRFLAGRLRGDS